MSRFLDIALPLAALGYKVTPADGKVPRLKNWRVTGCTSDPDQLAQWSADFSNCNAGVVRSPGHLQMDLDNFDWWIRTIDEANIKPFQTRMVRTGGGGLHLYWDDDIGELVNIKNPRFISKEKTPDQREFLVEFPYFVVAPGSVHPITGKKYEWMNEAPAIKMPMRSLLISLQTRGISLDARGLWLVRKDWNPIEQLAATGLKFVRRDENGAVWLDYHNVEGQACLLKKTDIHHSNGRPDGPRQSTFRVVEHEFGWDVMHQCFSCQQVRTKEALAALNVDLKDILISPGETYISVDCAADIPEKKRFPLWPLYLYFRELHHFGGASVEGKSPTLHDIVARVTTGRDWPDGTKNELGARSVALLAGEDNWNDTLIPRLMEMGANLEKVYRISATMLSKDARRSERMVALCSDLEKIDRATARIKDLALIAVDPITSYLGPGKKINAEEDVRPILQEVVSFAARREVVAVTVGHLNKKDNGTDVLVRLLGAAGFGGVCRYLYFFSPDPLDRENKYAHQMAQRRPGSAPTLRYTTVAVPHKFDGEPTEPAIVVKWGEKSDCDAQDGVDSRKAPRETRSEIRETADFVRAFLKSGEKAVSHIRAAVLENGLKWDDNNTTYLRNKVGAEKVAVGSKISWRLKTVIQDGIEFNRDQSTGGTIQMM